MRCSVFLSAMLRLSCCILLCLALLAPLWTAAPAAAASPANPPTAPCYAAAIAALTKRGALYSQGGTLPDDPIDPASGQPYPRTGPSSFDCSGLVWWAYAQAGIAIGQTTYAQLNDGAPIPCTLAQLGGAATTCWALGDLLFLRYNEGQHVAIYAGSGLFMDCYNHAVGCVLDDVRQNSFYQANFYQARRIVAGCTGLTYDPGQPTPVGSGGADFEAVADLVGPVSFAVPWQCG